MPPAALRGPAGMERPEGLIRSSGSTTSPGPLARRWQQWQQQQRDRRRATAAAAAAVAPARRDRSAVVVVAASATTPTTAPNLSGGGARLTAAIKATRDPQQLLDLLRRADPTLAAAVDAGSRRPSSSSPLNPLHAAAALTHCAQLLVAAEAEASPGMWIQGDRGRRPINDSAAINAAALPLLALAALHAPRFTPRQCANAMWAVARLGWLAEEDGAIIGRARAARQLLAALAARLDGGGGGGSSTASYWPQLQPQELVMALEAAAATAASTTSTTDLPWLRGCLFALREAAPTLGAREHCCVAAALARLLAASPPGSSIHVRAARSFTPLVLDPALRGAWMYGPRDVASLLQALSLAATCRRDDNNSGGNFRPPAAWVAAFLRAATDSADSRRAAEAAAGIGGDDDEKDDREQQQQQEDASNDARATAAALLALARLGFLPPRSWLAERLRSLGSARALCALGPGGLAPLGYAVARSGARPPVAWTRAWLAAVLEAWQRGGGDDEGDTITIPHRPPTAQEAAMTTWSLAKLRARPPEAWMAALALGAARAVQRCCEGGGGAEAAAAACVASSTLLWAFGRMGYRPGSAVLRVLYRALLISPCSSPSARCLATGLGAAARLSSPPLPSTAAVLPPGALDAWLRASAASDMCDVDATDAETRRARAVGAWALATLAAPAAVPPHWRRAFLTAAAAGILAVDEEEEEEEDDDDEDQLQEAAALAWAAARSLGGGRRRRQRDQEEEAAAAAAAAVVVLAALRTARRALARAQDDGIRSDPRSIRRRASAALLCVWSGAVLAQRQAVAVAAAAASSGEAAAVAADRARSALRLRRATVATMRAFASDADGCARVVRARPRRAASSSPLASRATSATTLLRSAAFVEAAAAVGAPRKSLLTPPLPAEWVALVRKPGAGSRRPPR